MNPPPLRKFKSPAEVLRGVAQRVNAAHDAKVYSSVKAILGHAAADGHYSITAEGLLPPAVQDALRREEFAVAVETPETGVVTRVSWLHPNAVELVSGLHRLGERWPAESAIA